MHRRLFTGLKRLNGWDWLTLAAGFSLVFSGCSTLNLGSSADPTYERAQDAIDGGAQPASYEAPAKPDQPPPLKIDDFAPTQIGTTFKRFVGLGPHRQAAAELYDQGQEKYAQASTAPGDQRQELFDEAAKLFLDAASRWPNSALEEDALYMTAECYFFADALPTAAQYYEKLLKSYPNSRYLDKVQARRFAIGKYWAQLHEYDPRWRLSFNFTDRTQPRTNTHGLAIKLFDKIVHADPGGDWADDATMAMAVSYFTTGDYFRAASYFKDVRTIYPQSEHQFMAHFLGLKAKLLSYDGPAYGAAVLEESEKLIRQIHKQFPQEAKQQQEYLRRAFAEVRFKLAEQEWRRASYYDRRGEYGAARLHYQRVAGEYSDTPFGPRAKERLTEIADWPATPPQRLGWLVDIFDTFESAKNRKLPQPDGIAQ